MKPDLIGDSVMLYARHRHGEERPCRHRGPDPDRMSDRGYGGDGFAQSHYCVVNSTTAMAIDSPTADTAAVFDRTPIARRVPAKAMMMGVAVSRPICASV